MTDRLKRILATDYEKWKVSPSGVIVALAKQYTYSKSRIMVGIDEVGFSNTF